MIQFQISQDGLGEDAGRIMEMHFTMVLIILGYRVQDVLYFRNLLINSGDICIASTDKNITG